MAMGLDTWLMAALLVVLGAVWVDAEKVYSFCHPQQSQIVTVGPDSEAHIFRTNKYTEASPKYENCTMVLESGDKPIEIRVNFRQFSLDAAKGCLSVYLCLNGVYHCGSWQEGKLFYYILPERSRSTIVLKTNFSHPKEPTELGVKLRPVELSRTISLAYGDGSDNNTMNYTLVNYSPGMTYTDLCASRRSEEGITTTMQPTEPTGKPTITTLAPIATTEGTTVDQSTTELVDVSATTAEPGKMAQKCTCTCYCRDINERCASNHTMVEAIVTGSTFIRRK